MENKKYTGRHFFGIIFAITNIFIVLSPVMAEIDEDYNYYHRNRDGTFLLEKLDETDMPVPLFRYVVQRQDQDVKKISGLYYGTGKIKFIDNMEQDKIIRSEYFDFVTGASVFVRLNTYTDGALSDVSISVTNTKWDIFQKRCFFSQDPHNPELLHYMSYQILETSAAFRADKYLFLKGIFNKEYLPVEIETNAVALVRESGQAFLQDVMRESYIYNDKGLLTHWVREHSADKTKNQFSMEESGTTITKKTEISNIYGEFAYAIHEIRNGDNYSRQYIDPGRSGSFIENRRVRILKDDLMISYSTEDLDNAFFYIDSNDERVYFDKEHTVETRAIYIEADPIRYPLDVIQRGFNDIYLTYKEK
jgi:hypothetical protein